MVDLDTLLLEADQKKLNGEHREAITICERILMSDINFVEAYEEIGDNFLSLREYERAEKALQRAVLLDPISANANYLLGFTYSALGDWRRSIEYLDTADHVQRNHPEILRCLGWSLFHLGERKKGIIILERALALSWDDCLILCDLGVCYLNEKNFNRSLHLFRKVLTLEPDNDKAKECLKACMFFQKEYQRMQRNSN